MYVLNLRFVAVFPRKFDLGFKANHVIPSPNMYVYDKDSRCEHNAYGTSLIMVVSGLHE